MIATDTQLQRWRHAADTFNALGWFLPAYIIAPAVFGLVKRIDEAPPQNQSAVLADGVCELYAPRALAVMYLYRYRKWPFVREFDATIFECVEAASYGFLRVATTGLAPVVEGIARGIARDQGIEEAKGAAKLIRDVLDNLGARAVSAASRGLPDEVELIVSSYRRFFGERFWNHTRKRPQSETLNRHGLLHGITIGEDYGTRYNFSRLVSILDLFCFLIALVAPQGERLSLLAPDETDASRELANYLGFAFAGRVAAERLLNPSRPCRD